jgi:hypothetical protein
MGIDKPYRTSKQEERGCTYVVLGDAGHGADALDAKSERGLAAYAYVGMQCTAA